MKRRIWTALATACAVGAALPAPAQTIGVAMSNFDDNFLTLLREAMASAAEEAGASLQFEDAQRDVGRQLSQVENFVASGLDGLIIAPVDSDSTVPMSAAAEGAGIPVVYVNNVPVNLAELPPNQVFVGSLETEAGQLQAEEMCRQLREAGKEDGADAVILLGDLSNQATRLRTQANKEVLATPECSFITVVDEQTAMWQRTMATDLMTNWLTAGQEIDAIFANNDEMAIGVVQALRSAGVNLDDVVLGGIDATPDAVAAVASGDMDVTVLQSASGQGQAAIDAMLALIAGEEVQRETYVPFELVTPENYQDYQ